MRAVNDVKSAHTQVVNRSFAIKGALPHFLVVAGDPPQKQPALNFQERIQCVATPISTSPKMARRSL
jgi:hypothetical protein